MLYLYLIMDADIKKLLEQNLQITKNNNRMLRTMRRNAFYGTVIRILFFIIILGVPTYIYFTYLAPLFAGNSTQAFIVWRQLLHFLNIPIQTFHQILNGISSVSGSIKQ